MIIDGISNIALIRMQNNNESEYGLFHIFHVCSSDWNSNLRALIREHVDTNY